MKTQYTPGPWKARQWGETIDISNGDTSICNLNPCGVYDSGIPKRIHSANARLIASAPDLLEALKGMLNNFKPGDIKKHYSQNVAVSIANSAIAKAEGGN